MIERRFNKLDTPIKELLDKDSIKEEIISIMNSINLTKDYYLPVAQNIAFFLLQIMEPKDLREEISKDLPDIRKDLIDTLIKKINELIIGKDILTLIDKNWEEDELEANEVAEEMEMSLVPTPPNIYQDIKVGLSNEQEAKQIIQSIRPSKTMAEKDVLNWEDKLKEETNKNTDPVVTNRITTDVSMPDTTNDAQIKPTAKITMPTKDAYREITEESI